MADRPWIPDAPITATFICLVLRIVDGSKVFIRTPLFHRRPCAIPLNIPFRSIIRLLLRSGVIILLACNYNIKFNYILSKVRLLGGIFILLVHELMKSASPERLRRSFSMKCAFVVACLALLCVTALIPVEVNAAKEFKTVFYSFGDVIIFSYHDGLTVSIYSSNGTKLTTQSLNMGGSYFFHPGEGIYHAVGDKPFSILLGDPVSARIMGYFAADDSFRGVSNEFYSYVAEDQDVIVFAYNKGTTDVTVTEWDGKAWVPLSQFTLNGPGTPTRVP